MTISLAFLAPKLGGRRATRRHRLNSEMFREWPLDFLAATKMRRLGLPEKNARRIVQHTRIELPDGICRSPNLFSGSVHVIGRQPLHPSGDSDLR